MTLVNMNSRNKKIALGLIAGFTLGLGSFQISNGYLVPGTLGVSSGLLFTWVADRLECLKKCRRANNKLRNIVSF